MSITVGKGKHSMGETIHPLENHPNIAMIGFNGPKVRFYGPGQGHEARANTAAVLSALREAGIPCGTFTTNDIAKPEISPEHLAPALIKALHFNPATDRAAIIQLETLAAQSKPAAPALNDHPYIDSIELGYEKNTPVTSSERTPVVRFVVNQGSEEEIRTRFAALVRTMIEAKILHASVSNGGRKTCAVAASKLGEADIAKLGFDPDTASALHSAVRQHEQWPIPTLTPSKANGVSSWRVL